jgi:hypothetical protein
MAIVETKEQSTKPDCLWRLEAASRSQRIVRIVFMPVLFLLFVAGGKMNIGWPPTMDPAVACKRPKVGSPHPPEPSPKEIVESNSLWILEAALLEQPPEFDAQADARDQRLPFRLTRHLPFTKPRYLEPFLILPASHHLAPPA